MAQVDPRNRYYPSGAYPDHQLNLDLKTIYDIVYATPTGGGPQGPQGSPGAQGPQGASGGGGGGSSDFAMDFLIMGG